MANGQWLIANSIENIYGVVGIYTVVFGESELLDHYVADGH